MQQQRLGELLEPCFWIELPAWLLAAACLQRQPPRMELGDEGGFFMETLHVALLRSGFDPNFR
jgi:hypothetical protein